MGPEDMGRVDEAMERKSRQTLSVFVRLAESCLRSNQAFFEAAFAFINSSSR